MKLKGLIAGKVEVREKVAQEKVNGECHAALRRLELVDAAPDPAGEKGWVLEKDE